MATVVTWNGSSFTVPATGEENWGGSAKVDGLLVSLVNNGFQKTGGTFTLTADAYFGATYGIKSQYFKSATSNIADAGILRLANTDGVVWRNAANNANKTLQVNASNYLAYDGSITVGANNVFAGDFCSNSANPATVGVVSLANAELVSWRNAANSGNLSISFGSNNILTVSGGVLTAAFLSSSSSIADSGVVRLANAEGIRWRNAADNANKTLLVNSSNYLSYDGSITVGANNVFAGDFCSNSANIATVGIVSFANNEGAAWRNAGNSANYTLLVNASNVLVSTAPFTSSATITATTGFINPTDILNTEIATPATPGAGTRKIYAKSDGIYQLNSSGLETKLAAISSQRASVIGDSPNGHGAINTKIRRWTNSATTGTDLTYADSANNGMTVTVNTTGLYALSYSDNYTGGNFQTGWSVNSAQLTTNINSITVANRLAIGGGPLTAIPWITVVALLTAGDVVRTHDQGTCDGTADNFQFRVIKIQD